MLAGLTIRNVVLIDQLEIRFQKGFCALTGETGAGKSILLDSLGLALGGRSEGGLIRKGAEQAQVSAEFLAGDEHPVHAFLKEQGLESDGTLILRRVLGRDGRSRAFINDQPVSVSLLRQAGETLIEVHSQFETHGLLDAATHRAMLDEYAGLCGKVREVAALWQSLRAAETALETTRAEAEKARADEDFLRHAVTELEALSPEAGEEEAILIRRESLKHREQILTALQEAWEHISGESGAELSASRAARALDRVAARLPEDRMNDTAQAIARAGDALQEAVGHVQAMQAVFDDSGDSLERLDDRLYALRGLARKHRVQPDELPGLLEDFRSRLDLAVRQDGQLGRLEKAVKAAETDYLRAAEALSAARAKAAEKLDDAVARELPPLKLDKARFVTRVETRRERGGWGPEGIDSVCFLVATNPGAEPAALGKIASGGEMSRFMLAIKVVMAATGQAQALVFDEVDSGIGGSTAAAVGERLARLALDKQILVVTHSPQVAARASHHWIVMKRGKADVTTTVIPLSELADRQEEIARMISGADITGEARAAARKLLETGT